MATFRHKDTLFAATFMKSIGNILVIFVKNVLSFGPSIVIQSKNTNFAGRRETI